MEQMRPIGYWVKRLDRAIEARFERTLAGHALNRRHWQVLNALREDVRTEGEVERMLEPFWTEDAITWAQVKADLLSRALISSEELNELVAAGCVCDTMCNFLDAEGRTVAHPLNDRVMSIDLESVSKARHIVLASGGAHRAVPIRATIKRVGCNTLITDEAAAKALIGG